MRDISIGLSIIKNGYKRNLSKVFIRQTKGTKRLLISFWRNGLIFSFSKYNDDLFVVHLKYILGKRAVEDLKIISKPSRLISLSAYKIFLKKKKKIHPEILFIDTPKGVFSNTELLQFNSVFITGGVCICAVYI